MDYLLTSLETERILFRNIDLGHYKEWIAFFKDPITSQHWTPAVGDPQKACTEWYQNQFYRHRNNLGGMNALIEKRSGRLMGHCGLLVQTVDGMVELEVAYSLLPDFWNMGLATEAAQACRDHAFANGISDSLISIISLSNAPSEKVALKNGMKSDRRTVYKNNEVNIFRIFRYDWEQL
ncbi:MAG: GNAT family N-acetyltransferase [Sediminicola sp.]